jgi:hypothetical protein
MILELSDIENIIKTNPNRSLVRQGCDYSRLLRMHLYGERMDSYLTTIEGFEKPALRELRVKYSKSNKDLFSRLGRPIDKVFSAKGGSIYYNLTKEGDKQAASLAANVYGGLSIKKWIEQFWLPHFKDDPYGLIFMEMDQEARVYPTYKSIHSIYDYQFTGLKLDYIVFPLSRQDKIKEGLREEDLIYRVVDDAFDYTVKWDGEKASIIDAYPNYFMEVPALINSDLVSPQGGFLSLFDEVISLADQFLLKSSIKATHEFLHGFPKYWEYADDCPECSGSKYKNGAPCDGCGGSGKKTNSTVSDRKLLQYPQTKEDPIVTPAVAGYVEPSINFYEISVADLQDLEDAMNITLWGKSSKKKAQPLSASKDGQVQTATEIVDEQQPMIDRLSQVADMAEKRHKFILDSVISLTLRPSYSGASVNYGRRYMLESADAIWDKYQKARSAGVSYTVLDEMLNEYYETKYTGDPISLDIAKKLMSIEPFIHDSIGVVTTFPVTDLEKQRKVYYQDWLATKTDAELFQTDKEALDNELTEYTKGKVEGYVTPHDQALELQKNKQAA